MMCDVEDIRVTAFRPHRPGFCGLIVVRKEIRGGQRGVGPQLGRRDIEHLRQIGRRTGVTGRQSPGARGGCDLAEQDDGGIVIARPETYLAKQSTAVRIGPEETCFDLFGARKRCFRIIQLSQLEIGLRLEKIGFEREIEILGRLGQRGVQGLDRLGMLAGVVLPQCFRKRFGNRKAIRGGIANGGQPSRSRRCRRRNWR